MKPLNVRKVDTASYPPSQPVMAKVDSAGRILVPARLRRELGVEAGDEVQLILRGSVLEVRSLDDTIREAQALVRTHVSKKKSLVRELLEERRQEASDE